MVMIFGGIDFPVFEVMLVIAVLFVCALAIIFLSLSLILKELKELKSLLTEEEKDEQRLEKFVSKGESELTRLEEDIKKLEAYEGRPDSDKGIKKYIRDNLDKGFQWQEIRKTLISQGYNEKDVEQMYKDVSR